MMAASKTFSLTATPHLLDGETIELKKNNIRFFSASKSVGTVYLTNYRILFVSHDRSTYVHITSEMHLTKIIKG